MADRGGDQLDPEQRAARVREEEERRVAELQEDARERGIAPPGGEPGVVVGQGEVVVEVLDDPDGIVAPGPQNQGPVPPVPPGPPAVNVWPGWVQLANPQQRLREGESVRFRMINGLAIQVRGVVSPPDSNVDLLSERSDAPSIAGEPNDARRNDAPQDEIVVGAGAQALNNAPPPIVPADQRNLDNLGNPVLPDLEIVRGGGPGHQGYLIFPNRVRLQALADLNGTDLIERMYSKVAVGGGAGLDPGDLVRMGLVRTDTRRTPADMPHVPGQNQYPAARRPPVGGRRVDDQRPAEAFRNRAQLTETFYQSEVKSTYDRDANKNRVYGVGNMMKLPPGQTINQVANHNSPMQEFARLLRIFKRKDINFDQKMDIIDNVITEDQIRAIENPVSQRYKNKGPNLLMVKEYVAPPSVYDFGGYSDLTGDRLAQFRKRMGKNFFESHETAGNANRWTLNELLKEVRSFSRLPGTTGYNQTGLYLLMLEGVAKGEFRDRVEQSQEDTPFSVFWNQIQDETGPTISVEAAIVAMWELNMTRPSTVANRLVEIEKYVRIGCKAEPESSRASHSIFLKRTLVKMMLQRWWPAQQREVLREQDEENSAWMIARHNIRDKELDPDEEMATNYHAYHSLREIVLENLRDIPPIQNPADLKHVKNQMGKLKRFGVAAIEIEVASICKSCEVEPGEVPLSAFGKANNKPAYENKTSPEDKPEYKGVKVLCTFDAGPHWPKNCESWPGADRSKEYPLCNDEDPCGFRHPPGVCHNKGKVKLVHYDNNKKHEKMQTPARSRDSSAGRSSQ